MTWSGTDAGSGIAGFDVYASDNNGPYTIWLSGTTATSATFVGQDTHTYRFYTVATDNLGHVEPAPATPDATTTVALYGLTGQVRLQGYVGGGAGAQRLVTFKASNASGVLKTWTVPLSAMTPVSADTYNFTLADPPPAATHLSAKTAWTKRRRLACSFGADNQAVVNFNGASELRGGDINGDNTVNFADYLALAARFNHEVSSPLDADDTANINGDDAVNVLDYSILANNWLTRGDAQ